MCSRNKSFKANFSSRLKETSLKPECSKRSPLGIVVSKNDLGRRLTEHNSHWLSYQEDHDSFDFSNRFDAEEVEWFLNTPLDMIEGRTCVHLEVLAQRVDKLTLLMRLGGSPNVRDITCGQSPLHYACASRTRCDGILEVLLRYGGDLYQRDNSGKTPLSTLQVTDNALYTTIVQEYLCTSCKVENFRTVEKLHEIVLQHGPLEDFKQLYFCLSHEDPRSTDLGHQTLLFRACKEGWIEGVSYMLSETKEVPLANQKTNETPLHAACEGNHYEIVVELISKFPELLLVKDKLPYRGWYPIHTACAYGASDKVLEAILLGISCLIEINGDDLKSDLYSIDELGRSPLYIATKCGNLSHIHLMTAPCLFKTLQQCVPSLYAITSGSLSQISVIHCAIAHDREELLQTLLDKFPLAKEVSAYPSVFSMIHMLTHMRMNVEGLNNKPVIFPLLGTTICESSDGILFLSGTSEAFDEYGILSNVMLSPLAMATAMGNREITEMLLDAGTMDDDGMALRIAIFLQHHEIVSMLLRTSDDTSVCLADNKKLSTFSLPSGILSHFTVIDLQHNCLDSLPLALFQIFGLEVLDVSHNRLTEIPVTDTPSPDTFNSSLVQHGWKIRNIKSLNINDNKLETLPAVLWKLPELKKLHAQHNSITNIEAVIEVCAWLEEIDISHNNLQNAPECVFSANTVNVSHNQLKSLPTCVWKSEHLKTLKASNNQLIEIAFPKSPCAFNREKRLSFTSKGRRRLCAEGNPSFFTQKNSKGMNESYVNGLSKLDLSYNKLTSFPTNLACFTNNLQQLHISGNNISVLYIGLLPPCIKSLKAMECNLKSIETTSYDQETLCQHKTHTSLNNLSYLYLKGNNIQQFSFKDDTQEARSLRFPKLETLDLAKNKLCNQLDANIGLQRNLTTLILNDNLELKSLPLELSCLSDTLKYLALDNLSGLRDPPKEYILSASNSPKRLLSYMKSRMKSSVQYRKLDLVIVGGSKKGKTSLVKTFNRKLKKHKFPVDEISINNWEYSPPKGDGPNLVFRMWDFPSQENDTTVNHHFYPKQAIYLAVFSLTDGQNGVKDLNVLLRNIKVHAPGCPVMIIGTHLDVGNVKEDDISEIVHQLYSDNSLYPTIAGVSCMSNTQHIRGSIKALRYQIYSVAMHLHTTGKNKLTLQNGKPLDDPDALLHQYIPNSYLSLQNEVEKKVLEMKDQNLAPMMNEKEFHNCFQFEDKEELASAVLFLHYQRKLFHFEDHSLDAFYFLDLQWIFNTMANIMKIPDSNGMILSDKFIAQSTLVIPETLQSGFLALLAKFDFAIPCKNNYALVYGLLPKGLEESPVKSVTTPTLCKKSQSLIEIPTIKRLMNLRKSFKKRIISDSLTTSFEASGVIVCTENDTKHDNDHIHSNNTATNDVDFTDTLSDYSTDEVPVDESKNDNINESLGGSLGEETSKSYKIPSSLKLHKVNVYQPKSFPQLSIVNSLEFEATSDLSSPHEILSVGGFSLRATYSNPVLHPNLCRVWMASFVPDGFWPQLFTRIISDNRIITVLSTLLFSALKDNECSLDYASSDVPSLWKLYQKGFAIEYENFTLLQLKQVSDNSVDDKFTNQIELIVRICEIALVHKTYKESACESRASKENVIRLATSILVLIEQHIMDIGEEWFPGVICSNHNKEVFSFVPCPLCISDSQSTSTLHSVNTNHQILSFNGCKAVCFSLKDLLLAYAQPSRTIKCPIHHDDIHVQQLAPDMCFIDLDKDIICGPDIPLKIDKDKELGRGGHALVLRGEILNTNGDQQRKLVAVKIINDELQCTQNLTDYLNSYTTTIQGYRMIRKEVSFLSTLHHHNLTQLCGVSTHPFMLLMELAPLGSLGSILKQYRAVNQVLTPAVLQASMHQVASAMAFLHEKHVVYFDLKSDNILVWKFPLPSHENADQDVLLKITDYGISRIAGATKEIRFNSITGTPGFIAPEVYTAKQQDLQSDKIDVFSFGMFLYELITLLKPFELVSDRPDTLIRNEQRPQIPKSKENFTPCLIQHIMKACWDQNPMRRPSMAQVVKWSQLPELQSLRTQYHLDPTKLLGISQCLVLRSHLHEHVTREPSNIQYTIPNSDHHTSLFSSVSAQTPQTKRKQNTTDHHTQVWIAQETENATSKLTIFTFRSSDLGFYVYEDSTTAKVVAMENVGNYMWVNTDDHKLHIIHTASMKTIVCITLENSILEVVQLLHVPEWHMVLVLWELPEIWCLYDEIGATGVHCIGSLQLNCHDPVCYLCKVTLSSKTEVWATRKDKGVTILTETKSGCHDSGTLTCTANKKLAAVHCNLISCLHFSTNSKSSLIHVWITFDRSPQLSCWDGETKNQIHLISLQSKGENCQATSLLGHKNHLYIGTSVGTVEVVESESGCFLQQFSWHAKVNALLKLPHEIKQSICAECSSTKCIKLGHCQSFKDDLIIPKKRISQEVYLQKSASGSQMPFDSKSFKSGLYSIQQSTPLLDSPLIVSLGNDFADCLNVTSNQNSMSRAVELLTWTGVDVN